MKRLGSSDSLGALIPICPNSTGEHNNNQGNNPMYARPEYHQAMIDGFEEEQCLDQDSCQLAGSEKKRRLSVDQVKALEKNFEVENKLEPERKVKLAHELGLQPRQVAVWFQNRRARWKTKQLERDYGMLKASYDGLKLSFEKLQHDNEALLKQIRELKSKINEDDDDNNNSDSKQSEKEDEFMSDSEEKSKLQTPIIPKPEKGSGSENLNPDENGAPLITGPDPSGFGDFKDGSSDSDNSSAILNEDNINNNRRNSISPRQHQFLEIGDDLKDGDKISNFQFQEPNRAFSAGKNIVGDAADHHHHHHQPFVKIEEHNFFGEESCSTFFSDDQPPSLHWYEWS